MTTPDHYREHDDRKLLRAARREAVGRILGELRYQTRPGVHTVGACSKGCGHSAHGSGVCKECLRGELAREVGHQFADAFCDAYFAARHAESDIWEEVER